MDSAFPVAIVTLLAAALAPPSGDKPDRRPLSLTMLAPPPPGALAFCQAHGVVCDAVPAASAMPDGGRAATPMAWRHYCRRNREDPACAR